MALNRREMLAGLGTIAAGAAVSRFGAQPLDAMVSHGAGFATASSAQQGAGFPRKADFNMVEGYTYISGAYTHPMPIVAADAYRRVVDRRATVGIRAAVAGGLAGAPATPTANAKVAFAQLINAKPSEVSYIPNTSTGENLVVEALGIAKNTGNVVTDTLHFEGALVHLLELKKQGLDLRVVKHRPDGHVDLKDFERVIDNKTKLVEVSLVSMYNGFQHDLKAVCDLAHAHGAYVYADVIQGVGAVPFDVRATNVDFAATSSYKWLMGDFGIGFLYVREDLIGTVIKRTHWSYESAPDTDIHLSPLDPANANPVTYTPGNDASTHIQLGTMASAVGAALGASIPYIQSLGVENIQRHRQPMIDRLQQEMPRLGFVPQTPLTNTSPIVTFGHKDAATLNRKLLAGRVNIRVADYWMRIAPSVYNDMADIDRLLEVLS